MLKKKKKKKKEKASLGRISASPHEGVTAVTPFSHKRLEDQTRYLKHSLQISCNSRIGLWAPREGKLVSSIILPAYCWKAVPRTQTREAQQPRWAEERVESGETQVFRITQWNLRDEGAPESGRGGTLKSPCTRFMSWNSTRLEKDLQESSRPNNFRNSHGAKRGSCSRQPGWKDLVLHGHWVQCAEGTALVARLN